MMEMSDPPMVGVKIWWKSEFSFRYKDEDLQRDEKGNFKMRPAEIFEGETPYDEPIPKDGAKPVAHWVWNACWKAMIGSHQYGGYSIVSRHNVGEATEIWEVSAQDRHDMEKALFYQYQDTYAKLTGLP